MVFKVYSKWKIFIQENLLNFYKKSETLGYLKQDSLTPPSQRIKIETPLHSVAARNTGLPLPQLLVEGLSSREEQDIHIS